MFFRNCSGSKHYILYSTDVLTKNLVTIALEWDSKENINIPQSQRKSSHLDNLNDMPLIAVEFALMSGRRKTAMVKEVETMLYQHHGLRQKKTIGNAPIQTPGYDKTSHK